MQLKKSADVVALSEYRTYSICTSHQAFTGTRSRPISNARTVTGFGRMVSVPVWASAALMWAPGVGISGTGYVSPPQTRVLRRVPNRGSH